MRKKLNKDGDVKYETYFAWMPITIGYERRWLEEVTIKYIYKEYPNKWHFKGWNPIEFVD